MFTCCIQIVQMISIDLVFSACFLQCIFMFYLKTRSICVSLLSNGSGFFNSSCALLHVMPFSCRSGSVAGAHEGDSDPGCGSLMMFSNVFNGEPREIN